MNEKDREWLYVAFPSFQNRTLRKETLDAYYKAEMLLNGWDKQRRRDCSCEYRSLKEQVDNKHHKWTKNQPTPEEPNL
jgi:hypothetical protein